MKYVRIHELIGTWKTHFVIGTKASVLSPTKPIRS
jgi:hypothetical protein